MLNRTEFWTLTVAGVLALVVALVNMYLFQANRGLQARANDRAQYIQQSAALENLYRSIVSELADRAIKTRDDQIRDMFAELGLNLSFDAPPDADKGGKQ